MTDAPHVDDSDAQDALWQALCGDGNPALYEHLYANRKPHLIDVADLMISGVEPPAMLVDDWLVEGELHWIFADPEAGKTWVALRLAIDVMEQGKRVAYMDEELGGPVIAERLLALGADPKLVRSHFAYAPFPSWQMSLEDAEAHRDFLRAFVPHLAVYDTVTDSLSEADLDENSGVDVTRWVKTFVEEARKVGAAQLVLDHTGHVVKGRAVGSRAKKAKAKVSFSLKLIKRFDSTTVGEIEAELQKNTRGAALPALRRFAIGGTPFQFEPVLVTSAAEAAAQGVERRQVQDAVPLVESDALSVRAITKACDLPRSNVERHLDALERDGLVRWRPGARSAHLYWQNYSGDTEVDAQ